MCREVIEDRLRSYFGPARTALAAALSEVHGCFTYPEFLSAVREEMHAEIPDEELVVRWAITRGRQWAEP
ncbi:MAG: hypothetical protein JO244_12765 [Solirubrobacterales bacterium]|nr:hypothetical protein [Solirubrobacterales bacterium]